MKIAIIADPIDNQKGGVQVYTRELVHALLADPGRHTFLLVRERRDPDLHGATQVAIPNIRIGLGLAALRLFFVVPLVLLWHRVDAVLEPAHFGPFNLPKRIKRITMIHDLTPLRFPHYHRFHSQLLQRIFLKGILRRADLILANSRHTAADIAAFFPFAEAKTKVILLGCDPAIRPAAHLPLPDDLQVKQPYWLNVGTIEPRKNLIRLLEAYSRFRNATGEKVQLVITGQKGWKSEPFFEALAVHPYHEDIVLTGYVSDEDLSKLYSHALAMIYPSEYEGFGLPVLEAMSCGCPVICSSVSSLPEVGGEVAFYFEPNSSDALAQHMIAVHGMSLSERKTLHERALHRADAFSWADHVRQLHQAFDALEDGSPLPIDQGTRGVGASHHGNSGLINIPANNRLEPAQGSELPNTQGTTL